MAPKHTHGNRLSELQLSELHRGAEVLGQHMDEETGELVVRVRAASV